jgi:hypothetical protein
MADIMYQPGATPMSRFVQLIAATLFAAPHVFAQTSASGADTVVFIDGEKLIGELQSANANTVTFKSESVGEVSVPWKKIQELHSKGDFAVLLKQQKIRNQQQAKSVPEGAISATATGIEVTAKAGEPPRKIPVAESAYIVDKDEFDSAFESPDFFGNWTGSITMGTSFVVATQDSENLTGELNLVRTVPNVAWRGPSNRTLIDFTTSYSWSQNTFVSSSQPGVKTFLYQGSAERDQYFSARLFGFATAIYNHNLSQNLRATWADSVSRHSRLPPANWT